jgi:hypothetical protein
VFSEAQKAGAGGLAFIRVRENGEIDTIGAIKDNLSEAKKAELLTRTGAQPGTLLLFGAGDTATVNKALDRVRQFLARELGLVPKDPKDPVEALRRSNTLDLEKAEKERWNQIKKAAEAAERWEQFVFSRVERFPVPEIPKPKKLTAVEKHPGQLLTYVGLQDVHVGAHSWEGEVGPEEAFDTKICRERVMDILASAVARVRRFGELGQILLPCGGDFFHIDTPGKTTTKSTPQDVDGPLPKIMVDGFALAAEIVNYLAQASGSVQVLNSAGNHDHTLSLVLLKWLEVAFRNRPDVQVRPDMRPRQYYRFGQNLIGVTHGDGPKDAKLPMLMATEAKEHWSQTRFRYWFSGHFHTQFANEFNGVQVHHHSSLKGQDRWHHNEGYVGNVVGMNMYVIDHDDGMLAHMPVAAKL